MKKIFCLFSILILISTSGFSQVELAEVNKMYTFYLKDGNIIKGRITQISDTKVYFKYDDGNTILSYDKEEIAKIEEIQYAKRGSIGIGIGVPYGIFGINGELAVHKFVSLSAGLGTTVFAGLGYSAGARLYLKPVGEKWRPRISAHYGINAMITDEYYGEAESFAGITVGAGVKGMFGTRRNSGFDFEIVYFVTQGEFDNRIAEINKTEGYEIIQNPGKVRITVGYHFGF